MNGWLRMLWRMHSAPSLFFVMCCLLMTRELAIVGKSWIEVRMYCCVTYLDFQVIGFLSLLACSEFKCFFVTLLFMIKSFRWLWGQLIAQL